MRVLLIILMLCCYVCADKNIYVDKANGNNADDGLTTSTAKADLQNAIDIAEGGDTIFVANTTKQTVPANGYTWTTGYNNTNSLSNYLLIDGRSWRGENSDGALVISNPAGSTFYAAELDGNAGTINTFNDSSKPLYVCITGFKIHNTNGCALDPQDYWQITHCEITNTNQTSEANAIDGVFNGGFIAWCWIHDDGGTSEDGVELGNDGTLLNCLIENMSSWGCDQTNGGTRIIGNIFRNCTDGGVRAGGDRNIIERNTFISDDTAGIHGVDWNGSAGDSNLVTGNLFVDHAIALDCAETLHGYNAYYSCAVERENTGTEICDMGGNITLGSNPFVNQAGGNYAVGTDLKNKYGIGSFLGTNTANSLDIGGAQRVEAGGTTIQNRNNAVRVIR